VLDEQQNHSTGQEEEDELRERIRRRDVPGGIDDRGDDQKREGGPDRISPVESGPYGVGKVGDQEGDEDRGVRDVHRPRVERGAGLLPYAEAPSKEVGALGRGRPGLV